MGKEDEEGLLMRSSRSRQVGRPKITQRGCSSAVRVQCSAMQCGERGQCWVLLLRYSQVLSAVGLASSSMGLSWTCPVVISRRRRMRLGNNCDGAWDGRRGGIVDTRDRRLVVRRM